MKTQIWIAISVYVLLAIVRKRLSLELNLYPMAQILSLSFVRKNATFTGVFAAFIPQPKSSTLATKWIYSTYDRTVLATGDCFLVTFVTSPHSFSLVFPRACAYPEPWPPRRLYELVCLDHSCLPTHFPDGRRCQQPAVRRRARRCTLILRFRVPETSRDLAWNKSEINRVLATERLDPDAALMILWAMDLTAETLPAKPARRPRPAQNRAPNPNGIYDVPLNSLLSKSLSQTLSQLIENTKEAGGGGTNTYSQTPQHARCAPRCEME